MNKRNVNPNSWNPNKNHRWIHDTNGQVMSFYTDVVGLFPEYAMTWADGEYGGYEFRTLENVSFRCEIGVRGIGYVGVVAFDQDGKGKIFLKD